MSETPEKEPTKDEDSVSLKSTGKNRDTWGAKFDCLLALVGFSVGLGNVWRFPYLCYKNGGGAFLIPYLTCVIVGAFPLLFLEISLGQFMSQGGINAWLVCPILQGIGWATTTVLFFLNCYYEVILAWAFYYFFSSFAKTLPWDSCGNEWNTPHCNDITIGAANNSQFNDSSAFNESYESVITTGSPLGWINSTFSPENFTGVEVKHKIDPVTEFWENKVLGLSDGIENVGAIKWDICLCLLLSWILVYLCICKGIVTFAKIVYVTAIVPYVLMTTLLIRGVTLPGALDGIKFYIIPNFTKLATMEVWVDAGTQVFFSYSIGVGGLTALGSYNTWDHNSYIDSVMFALVNSGTSVFAGFVIFSVLGFMAHQSGVDVADVAESGPGLAFVAYPKAISQMPLLPQFWAVIFFIMVILLGLDSQFVGVQGLITALEDTFPVIHKTPRRKAVFVAIVVIIHFLIGLSMCTRGGMYVFQLFDYYPASRIVVLIGFIECIAIAWIYGVNRYYDNLEMMFGFRINAWVKVCWIALCPIYCITIFMMSIVNYSVLTYKRPTTVYEYPMWAVDIGWTLAIIPIIAIAVTALHKVYQCCKSGKPLKTLIQPQGLTGRQLRPQDMTTNSEPMKPV